METLFLKNKKKFLILNMNRYKLWNTHFLVHWQDEDTIFSHLGKNLLIIK